jgi:hypothetical protein
MRRSARLISMVGVLWVVPFARAGEIRFDVRHIHTLRSCQGGLTFTDVSVEFSAPRGKHSRSWSYTDIQQIGLLGPGRVSILTYEGRKLKLGKDRLFEFEILGGAADSRLAAFLSGKVGRPLVSALPADTGTPVHTILVRHRRVLGGGSQGRLELSEQYVSFRSDTPSDSRIWRYGDISSVGTTGPFQLRLTTPERVRGEIGEERDFVFDLKSRLDAAAYDFIWWKINGPQIRPGQAANRR